MILGVVAELMNACSERIGDVAFQRLEKSCFCPLVVGSGARLFSYRLVAGGGRA
jgi:hypothetical protein